MRIAVKSLASLLHQKAVSSHTCEKVAVLCMLGDAEAFVLDCDEP
jgi:hypothetical protein